MPTSMQLMPHQQDAVRMLGNRPRVLIADPTGTGKTRTAIAWAAGRSRCTLVGCPSILIGKWVAEIRSVLPDDKVVGLYSTQPEGTWDAVNASGANWIVCSLDAPKTQRWINRSMWRIRPHAVLIDEAHALKTWKSQRTKSWVSLIGRREQDCPSLSVGLLTATPILRDPTDLVSLMAVLGIVAYYPTCRTEIQYHEHEVPAVGGGRRLVREAVGWKDSEFPVRMLKGISVQRDKSKLLKNLPALQRVDVGVPMKERSLARELRLIYKSRNVADVAGNVDAATELATSKDMGKAIEKVGLHVVGDVMRAAGMAKAKWIAEWIDQTIGSQKWVVFCRHKSVAHTIGAALATPHKVAVGDIGSYARAWLLKDFEEADAPRVFVSTYDACGVGLDMQAGTTAVLAELNYTPALETQAISRIHRLGQNEDCMAIRMLCDIDGYPSAFEQRVLAAHVRKIKHMEEASMGMAA